MAIRFAAKAAEQKYPWLTAVLDAYYINDAKVDEHLAKVSKKGTAVACHKGCDTCCLKPTVPFIDPELAAISWYASEVLSGEARTEVKERLLDHEARLECPFLIDGACSIYPVRPLACRQFLVKSKPCALGEDMVSDRPQDVIPLPRETLIRPVALRLLDHYEFKSPTAKRKAFETGFIHARAKNMHEFDWKIIAKAMEHFDRDA